MPTPTAPAAFAGWRCPEPLVEQFAAVFAVAQQQQARLMHLAAAMAARLPEQQREFVADDLAAVMNLHPRTAARFVHTAVAAARLPGLLPALDAGEITDRHVHLVVAELAKWAGHDEDQQARVWQLVTDRVRARLAVTGRWPTPGELRKKIATAALLLDLRAAEQARRSVADRRGVTCWQSAVGEGTLSITGPELQVVALADAIRARAEALGRLPGDTRTLPQRLFDATYDLLMVDADGGESAVPALDVDGIPVTIRVRGIEVQVLVPYSLTVGGDLELAEIPGFGPLLPDAARDVLAQADALRQVALDATTGEVLAVEDRLPVPHPDPAPAPEPEAQPEVADEPAPEAADEQAPASASRPKSTPEPRPETEPQPEPASELERDLERFGGLDPLLAALLHRMLDRPLQHLGPMETDRYRPSSRLLRALRLRDRTCCFPGCTTPARWTDGDHRDPWPRGATSTQNMHCLCRRHHRAKQAYFTVDTDQHGNTLWTTPDGRRYRRPPPRF